MNFAEAWKQIEAKDDRPSRLRSTRTLPWEEFRQDVAEQGGEFVRSIVSSLYHGDILILRNAFTREFMRELKEKTVAWTRSRPESFHKMLDGVPDFHRQIDMETGKKYSVLACKHSAYFFRWNDDPLGIWSAITERWSVLKVAMGLHADEYERNIPSDGPTDRIQVVRYLPKYGYLEPHVDAWQNQRCFISGYMSKRGEDFHGGGFYGVDANNNVIDLEDRIEVGDLAIGYASVCHGVAPCDRHKEPDWNATDGRWFLGLYSNDPDTGKPRVTVQPEKLDLPGVLP